MHTLKDAQDKIVKAYGKEAGGKGFKFPKFARLPTGILTLDIALAGGLPLGAISIIYGNEGSGKTSLALRAAAQFQKRHPKRKVIWIDVENSWDEDWVKLHGVNVNEVYLFRPTTAEEAADIVSEVAQSKDAGLIVIDSIAAMASIDQLEKSAEQVVVAGSAKPTNSMLRQIGKGIVEHSKAGQLLTALYINQTRTKIGFVMGNPEIKPGPKYQDFQSFLTLRLTGKKILKEKIAPVEIYSDNSARIVKKKFPCIRQNAEWQMILYPHEGHKPLDINNHKHAERLLEDLDYLTKDGSKGWQLFDVVHSENGELLPFKTKTEAVQYALSDYDALIKFLVDDMLLLYKDEIQANLEAGAKAGHK